MLADVRSLGNTEQTGQMGRRAHSGRGVAAIWHIKVLQDRKKPVCLKCRDRREQQAACDGSGQRGCVFQNLLAKVKIWSSRQEK